MTKLLIVGADLDRTDTWIKYERTMCSSCVSSCCTMPVEVRFNDLLRLGVPLLQASTDQPPFALLQQYYGERRR